MLDKVNSECDKHPVRTMAMVLVAMILVTLFALEVLELVFKTVFSRIQLPKE